jgi:Dimerisation domain
VSAAGASAVEPEAADRPPVSVRQAARLHEAFATTAAVASATELGVFAILEETPADPAIVAGACGLSERGAQALLGALAGLRLVERQENGLGLLQRTATGTIYPYSAYRRWLEEVGFEEARRRAIEGPLPLTLITARLR